MYSGAYIGLMTDTRESRRLELWRAKFMDRRDAPPLGWHLYLTEGWKANDWDDRYRLYLMSRAWRQRRDGALERAGHRCLNCGGEGRLHVHHINYQRAGTEKCEDLRVLCSHCHAVRHITPRGAQPIPLDDRTRYRLEQRALRAANR